MIKEEGEEPLLESASTLAGTDDDDDNKKGGFRTLPFIIGK